jgi:hypothetical protein
MWRLKSARLVVGIVNVAIGHDDDFVGFANSRQSAIKCDEIVVDARAIAVRGDDDGQGWREAG